MDEKVFTVILAIPSLDVETIDKAEKIFLSYKDSGVVRSGFFDDDTWAVTDEYANHILDFTIDKKNYSAFEKKYSIDYSLFKQYLKTYITCLFGQLSFTTMQHIILGIKRSVYSVDLSMSNKADDYSMTFWNRIIEFFSLLPCDDESSMAAFVEKMEENAENSSWDSNGLQRSQRSLCSFESYFRFDDILKRFWTESSEEEKLFYFPIWMWWNVSAILPLRPREFLLTPRKCLIHKDNKCFLRIRRDTLKGSKNTASYKISSDYKVYEYQIPEDIEKQIQWYLDATDDYVGTELNTLFITDTHYDKWGRCKPYSSRFFTYQNMRTCLRYFYEQIICEKYGYNIIFERDQINLTNEKEIEYIHLGDTRHIALINIIAEGATPMIAMLLAGHDNPEMSSHYYSNISTLIECRTYRQYKKMISGKQNYAISKFEKAHIADDFVLLENNGRCYSLNTKNHDYSDCCKAIGPTGEIGFCEECDYYRGETKTFTDSKELYTNRIQRECENLEKIIKKVRSGNGDSEEILQVLLRLKDESYSYQKYLMETRNIEDV